MFRLGNGDPPAVDSDNSLFHFGQPENIFNKQNKAFFIRDKYCHLMLSLHEVEPNYSNGISKAFSSVILSDDCCRDQYK